MAVKLISDSACDISQNEAKAVSFGMDIGIPSR